MGAFRVQDWVVLMIKNNFSQSTNNYSTILRPINRKTHVTAADYDSINDVTITSFDYLVDGPSGFLAFIGQGPPSSVTMPSSDQENNHNLGQSMSSRIFIVKAELSHDNKIVFSKPGTGSISSSDNNICPNSINFESTSDANQK